MAKRISLIETPPMGYRWQVLENGTVLKSGTENSKAEAEAAANAAVKELENKP